MDGIVKRLGGRTIPFILDETIGLGKGMEKASKGRVSSRKLVQKERGKGGGPCVGSGNCPVCFSHA